MGAAIAVVWRFVVWIQEAIPAPDPWGAEVDRQLQEDDLPPTCPHCSATYSEGDYFCPACGEAVGSYNNFNPYLYVFSLGQWLRTGTGGKINRSWLTITGYLLLSTVEYISLVLTIPLLPVYWFLFFKNLSETPPRPPAHADPEPLQAA
jgi:hypothetical protein